MTVSAFRRNLTALRLGMMLLVLALGIAPACAEKVATLDLSASSAILDNPNNAMIAKREAWQTQGALAAARSQPFLDLNNVSSDSSITRFTLSIGDEAFNFASSMLIEASSGVGVTTNIIDNGNLLELLFTNFTPGKDVRVQFQIKSDSASAYAYPDFRAVLFDVNGSDSSDNSEYSFTVEDMSTGTTETVSDVLADYQISGPVYMAPSLRSYFKMDMLNVFSADANVDPTPPPPVIPEPSSVVLLAIGSILSAIFISRERRKKKSW